MEILKRIWKWKEISETKVGNTKKNLKMKRNSYKKSLNLKCLKWNMGDLKEEKNSGTVHTKRSTSSTRCRRYLLRGRLLWPGSAPSPTAGCNVGVDSTWSDPHLRTGPRDRTDGREKFHVKHVCVWRLFQFNERLCGSCNANIYNFNISVRNFICWYLIYLLIILH